jgi:predicted phosphoribosyltransferase
MRFRDRAHAGRVLARALLAYAGRDDVVVLALPRGGVPVAAELARALGHNSTFRRPQAGLPEHEELAMGQSEVRPYVDWSRGESASAI